MISTFTRPPASVGRDSPYLQALSDAASAAGLLETMSVGRDGSSDAVSFLRAGVPAVEYGPAGEGHHGPEEWVSISSLEMYREVLTHFLRDLPARVGNGSDGA